MSFDDTCPQCGYPAYAGTCLEWSSPALMDS